MREQNLNYWDRLKHLELYSGEEKAISNCTLGR
jgi:hypothetical protein